MEHVLEIKIPIERVAVIIGKKGSTKKEIERLSNSKIVVNSKEGIIRIISDDPIKILQLRDVVLAIGRGFNPRIAELLLKMDYVLEIINITDYAKTKNSLIRLRGRVIGEKGRARKTIEDLTETYISVYGKTVAIIGEVFNVSIARKAIELLLSGSPHARVYSWLERKRKEIKYKEFLEMYK